VLATVTELRSPAELESIADPWRELLRATPRASFFQTCDWLRCYWRHFGHDQRLRVLVARDGNDVTGILPLAVRRESFRVGSLRVLTYPLQDWGSFYGPIGRDMTAILWAGLRHVLRSKRDWDLVDLRWIDMENADRGRTYQVMRQLGFAPEQSEWAPTARIELRGTWDDYWRSRRRKWRENVRRDQRRLESRGKVTYVRYRPEEGGGESSRHLFETCVELARRSWQGSSTTGTTMSHESIRPFLADMHGVAAAAGGLDVNLLYLDGRPIAFAYNYVYEGHVSGLRTGFDADPAYSGAGTVLYLHMIRDSFARGDWLYDLGAHYLDAKKNWLTHVAPTFRCTHYPWSVPRSQLLRLGRWCKSQATGSTAKALCGLA
jgi:CelD/BcsL family acetyltransferase involved in cellulose biosynthesis